jgi:hypothetical protein
MSLSVILYQKIRRERKIEKRGEQQTMAKKNCKPESYTPDTAGLRAGPIMTDSIAIDAGVNLQYYIYFSTT